MKSLLHADVVVSDMERSLGFYCGLLGAKPVEDARITGELPGLISGGKSQAMRLVMLRFGPVGAMLELIQFLPPDTGAAPNPFSTRPHVQTLSLLVRDLDSCLLELGRAGVSGIHPPMTVTTPKLGTSRVAFVPDPDGNMIELVEPCRE